jgi:LuxR family maltose regulon positive regulatory protein
MLIFLANGISNKEMAQKLFVSENTVKFHLKNVYSKLGVSNRLQAINAARQLGFIA